MVHRPAVGPAFALINLVGAFRDFFVRERHLATGSAGFALFGAGAAIPILSGESRCAVPSLLWFSKSFFRHTFLFLFKRATRSTNYRGLSLKRQLRGQPHLSSGEN